MMPLLAGRRLVVCVRNDSDAASLERNETWSRTDAMSGIFISYRRADAQGWAGRLGEHLAEAFGDVARFFDLASIPPGADFIAEI